MRRSLTLLVVLSLSCEEPSELTGPEDAASVDTRRSEDGERDAGVLDADLGRDASVPDRDVGVDAERPDGGDAATQDGDGGSHDGGPCTSAEFQVLACGLLAPQAIAVLDGYVYFGGPTSSIESRVRRVPTTGGDVEVVAEADPSVLVAAATTVFWSQFRIYAYDTLAGTTSTVAGSGRDGTVPQALVATPTTLFWTSPMTGEIRERDHVSGVVEVWVAGLNRPTGLVAGPEALFWISAGPPARLRARSFAARTSEVVDVSSEVSSETRLATTSTHLYWSVNQCRPRPCIWQIRRRSLARGDTEIFVGDAGGRPIEMAADESHLYWTTRRTLWRQPHGGGTAERVADGLWLQTDSVAGEPNGLEVQPEAVYLVDPQLPIDLVSPTGRIIRIAK